MLEGTPLTSNTAPAETQDQVPGLEIIEPGPLTTVQDYPGRHGLQAKGFFPAGPVDHFAFRAANVLVGNPEGWAALEITLGGFSARLLYDGLLALCGAEGTGATLNGHPLPFWESVEVHPDDMLSCGVAHGPGFRVYAAFSGGIAVPEVLGSRATYTIGALGGLDGRALARSDTLNLHATDPRDRHPRRLPQSLRMQYLNEWEIEVVKGPHADPDFLTEQDWSDLVSFPWRVDLNSNRVATRLNPHRFRWARKDGGIAGGHPSNVLDGSYPVGGILATGDVLTLLGPDGYTSGGFTVVATIPHTSLWKVGQLRPGRDTVTFREIGLDEALALGQHVDFALDPARLEAV
jgi:5-oxoprolinase (ATP-hydrolysing) subunit C